MFEVNQHVKQVDDETNTEVFFINWNESADGRQLSGGINNKNDIQKNREKFGH